MHFSQLCESVGKYFNVCCTNRFGVQGFRVTQLCDYVELSKEVCEIKKIIRNIFNQNLLNLVRFDIQH
jgi:hypothetical protein